MLARSSFYGRKISTKGVEAMIATSNIQSESVKDFVSELEKLDEKSKILVMTYTSALADRERMERSRAREEARKILASK